MDYPILSIKPSIGLSISYNRKTLKSPTEDGYIITRSQWTKARKTFGVSYSVLPIADYNLLLAFFEDQAKGGAEVFNWTHPLTGVVYQVRFSDDKLEMSYLTNDLVKCSFSLEEV